ncbi:MAG TPA: RNA polymerase factor sigma-54 [Pseudolabrys sp.]|nr:RNA polymerase factor sigma-54 [Pseudolabrys sp.]
MALSQRLELRQTQALVMTPQLMQAIKLLQLSSLDLAAYVEGELERNPLLERAAEDDLAAARENPERLNGEREQAGSEGDWIGEEFETSRSAMEAGLGTELENAFPDAEEKPAPADMQQPAFSSVGGSGPRAAEEGGHNLEAFVSNQATLADHLAEQIAFAISDPAQRMIGQYLIDMVDEAGYLSGDIAGIAEKLGTSSAAVEAVLAVLQTFDPAGVCARNLTECLAIQLRERDRYDPAMQMLVEHLDSLAKRDFSALRKLCGVNDEDLADMMAEIRNLNPKPGLAFGSTTVQPVVPDVFVRAAPDATWQVELNSDTLPKVLINQRYYTQISRTTRSDKEKSYIAECLQSATWLVRALDQRAKTILKVSGEIVRQQDAFFAKGVQHLRPLNLKTVADAIGMHESTVSRVTANKYMATPRGIFELKYFFTSAIAAADGGEAHSAEAVRHRIRQLIDAESAADVLSDDTIVEKLREAGVEIARRTVAKYREAMRIPSSVQRRRNKHAAGS